MGDYLTRRDVLRAAALAGLATGIPAGADDKMLTRTIPTTDESLPVIGLGTYSVFDVKGTSEELAVRRDIVSALLDAGGSVIDSSPMYGSSEQVIGQLKRETDR